MMSTAATLLHTTRGTRTNRKRNGTSMPSLRRRRWLWSLTLRGVRERRLGRSCRSFWAKWHQALHMSAGCAARTREGTLKPGPTGMCRPVYCGRGPKRARPAGRPAGKAGSFFTSEPAGCITRMRTGGGHDGGSLWGICWMSGARVLGGSARWPPRTSCCTTSTFPKHRKCS